jgi:hypothetical protein
VPIVNPAGIALNGGELSANKTVPMTFDGTSFRIIGPCPLNAVYTGLTANAKVVNCAGATSIMVMGTWTSTPSGLDFSLPNVSYGIPITVIFVNQTGATKAVTIGMSDPAGTQFVSILGCEAGSVSGAGFNGNLIAGGSGLNLVNGAAFVFNGQAHSGPTAVFSY